MSSNTLGADINEIWFGYVMVGKNWAKFSNDAKAQLAMRQKQVSVLEYEAQVARAEIMAVEFSAWAASAGYKGKPVKAYWTARPGAVPKNKIEFDQKKNPTDILLEYAGNKFIGVSAKSTKGSGDIGFKNPGLGTIEVALKIDLKTILEEDVKTIVKKLKLPESASERKAAIRANPTVQAKTQDLGSKTLGKVRDAMFVKLKSMTPAKLRDHIISNWMDAGRGMVPPYVKVTGMGNKPPFKAKVEDPTDNDKIRAIMNKPITLEKVGNEGIMVSAGGKKILRMRAKFESEKLASTIKFTADPA